MLGAGNGQFIIRCAKHTQATCIGIEIEASRCEETRTLIDQELKGSIVSEHDDHHNSDHHHHHDNNGNNQNDGGDDVHDDDDHQHHSSSSIRSTTIASAYNRCHIICCNALEYNNYHNGTCFFLYLVPRGLRLILPHLLTIPHKIRVITYMSPLPSTFIIRNRSCSRKINDDDGGRRRRSNIDDDNDNSKISNDDDHDGNQSCVSSNYDINVNDGIHEIKSVDIDSNQQYPLHHQMHAVRQHDDDNVTTTTHVLRSKDEEVNDSSTTTSLYADDVDDNVVDGDQTITKEKEDDDDVDDDIITIKPLNIYRVSTASHPDALWPMYYYELNLNYHHLS